MKVLVTFALENEFAPWRERHEFRAKPRNGSEPANVIVEGPETYSTEIKGTQVEVVLTGAGPKPASATIARIAHAGGIDYCVTSGLAGSLRPQYRIGEILTAREVCAGSIESASRGDTLRCSEALLSFAVECGARRVDTFHTAGRVISKAAEKEQLGKSADAVEMESYVIMDEARRRGIPAIAVRAISDFADEDLPFDMNGIFTDEGRISMPLVLAQMAKHPQSIAAVMKLGQSAKAAATALAGFLDRYIERLAAASGALEGNAKSAGE